MHLRPVTESDVPFLWEMLWLAAAVDVGMLNLGKDAALARPENQKYLAGWGRPGDAGVIAVGDTGEPLGAAWYRRFGENAHGYGFVAADIPEITIGVSESARGQGVGGALLDALSDLAREQGFQQLSLSVDRKNPAIALYERKGFRNAGISDPTDTSLTMVKTL